jgi:hypothetical protein
MSWSAANISSIGSIDQCVRTLDALCAKEKGEEVHPALLDATRAATKAWLILNRNNVETLTGLVKNNKYQEVTAEVLKFPTAAAGLMVQEIMALVYDGSNLLCCASWVEFLEGDLQVAAFKAFYELAKSNGDTDTPLMLKLLECAKNVPDDIRVRLEIDCRQIIAKMVQAIKNQEFGLFYLNNEEVLALAHCVPHIVRHFDVTDLEAVLLLVQFTNYTLVARHNDVTAAMVCALLEALRTRLLLDSEQALHVYALSKYHSVFQFCYEEQEISQLSIEAGERLSRLKDRLFVHYQQHFEDEQKIRDLHEKNLHLAVIVEDFIVWYYRGDLHKINVIINASRSIKIDKSCKQILIRLLNEMVRLQQTSTFEAFRVYNELIKFNTWVGIELVDNDGLNALAEQFRLPHCVAQLQLSSVFNMQLLLLNKQCGWPLCRQENKVLCIENGKDDEKVCVAKIDLNSALTTFNFKLGDRSWKLNAKEANSGPQWMIKAVDEHHIKIFTEDGKKFRLCAVC